jgi:tripeptidyl-peptidase-1
MTPNLLYSTYSIDPSLGNSFTTQAAAQCLDQTVRPLDITAFQTFFSLPQQSLDLGSSIGGHVTNSACKNSIDDCIEASLDYQYIMAVGRNVPTSAMYWEGCSWLTLLKHLQTLADPPKVLSISYSSYETDLGANYVSAFNIVAMQLGVLGVTFLASSGDDGVAGFKARTDASKCGYGPQFPASSPYVTAVGATLGPETGSTEIGCSVDAGGEVTSGGGFSVFSRFQSWQTTAISQYFLGVVQTPFSPVRGYSTNGRGYPGNSDDLFPLLLKIEIFIVQIYRRLEINMLS